MTKNYKSTIIVPCAGNPSFLAAEPKFLTINHRGHPMVVDAISEINLRGSRLVISVLKKHEVRYKIRAIFKRIFPRIKAEVCVLDRSLGSQSGDVYQTIKKMKVKGPFLSKDSDNIFRLDKVGERFNYVAVEALENLEYVDARNKSYISTDTSGLITAIEEKNIISNVFSMGGYYFLDPNEFVLAYETLQRRYQKSGHSLYISRIISYLILERNIKFKTKFVSGCVDFSTAADWLVYKSRYKTYFVDLDGVLVQEGREFLKPFWGDVRDIKENVDSVRALHEKGNQIVVITSRKESYRAATVRQLNKFRIPYHALLMNIFDTERILINDFSHVNPYPSARAVSTFTNDNDLKRYIGE